MRNTICLRENYQKEYKTSATKTMACEEKWKI